MPYMIGADIGTTNVKAVAFSMEGTILFVHSEEYPMYHPQAGWSEQDPNEILRAVEKCIQKVVDECSGQGLVKALSFSAAMHSLIALDEEGEPLTPSIIWADNRSASIADDLRQTEAGKKIYHNNGTPIHAMAPVCKLLWLREHKSDLFETAARFVGIKEFVVFKLTGKYLIDYSIASATGLFNIRELGWDTWTLNYIGLSANRLAKPVSPYHIEYLPENNTLGLSVDTAVVMGGSDGCLANLGSGATTPGEMAVTIGTSGAVRICTHTAYTDEHMRTFCYLLDETTYVVGGATNNGAVIFQWLKETFFPNEGYEALFDKAAEIKVGSDGLLCLPYLLGERAPLWNSAVRGGFVGMDMDHTAPHFVRAAMEGILLNMFTIGRVVMENQPIHTIYGSGGFAKNDAWVQMLADVFGIPVHLNDTVETGSVGAALIGLKALGLLESLDAPNGFTSIAKKCKPDLDNHRAYEATYLRFAQWAKIMDEQSNT